MRASAIAFAEQGFTTLEVELDPTNESNHAEKTLDRILGIYANELHRQVSLHGIFPPILVARGVSTLIGHTYVESFSVSGLALIGPIGLVPPTLDLPEAWKASALKALAVPTFSYEPRFPILHLEAWDGEELEATDELFRKHHSTWPDGNIDLKVIPSKNGALYEEKDVINELRLWLNDVGL